jgi:hypothetical protein
MYPQQNGSSDWNTARVDGDGTIYYQRPVTGESRPTHTRGTYDAIRSASPGEYDNYTEHLSSPPQSTKEIKRKPVPTPTVSTVSGSRRKPRHFIPWILELAALCLSICSLAAAIILLTYENGKPLNQWRFPTSINTVISALGVVSKASLAFAISASIGQHKWNWFRVHRDDIRVFETFDEASRGPWGSLNLLFSIRRWYSTFLPNTHNLFFFFFFFFNTGF